MESSAKTTTQLVAEIKAGMPQPHRPGADPERLYRACNGAVHALALVAADASDHDARLKALEGAVVAQQEKIVKLEESLAAARKAFAELKGKRKSDLDASPQRTEETK